MENIFNAANYVAQLTDMTNLLLQKVLYFSHAVHLSALDQPLFQNANFQKFERGPCDKAVWKAHLEDRRGAIKPVIRQGVQAPKSFLCREILKMVYNRLKGLSDDALSERTHGSVYRRLAENQSYSEEDLRAAIAEDKDYEGMQVDLFYNLLGFSVFDRVKLEKAAKADGTSLVLYMRRLFIAHMDRVRFLGWDTENTPEERILVEKKQAESCGMTFVEHVLNCYRTWKYYLRYGILIPRMKSRRTETKYRSNATVCDLLINVSNNLFIHMRLNHCLHFPFAVATPVSKRKRRRMWRRSVAAVATMLRQLPASLRSGMTIYPTGAICTFVCSVQNETPRCLGESQGCASWLRTFLAFSSPRATREN